MSQMLSCTRAFIKPHRNPVSQLFLPHFTDEKTYIQRGQLAQEYAASQPGPLNIKHLFLRPIGLLGGLVAQLHPTFQTPWTEAHQPPLFHGISQARILEWVAISFSRGSSQPRDRTQTDPGSPLHGRRILSDWASREAHRSSYPHLIKMETKATNHPSSWYRQVGEAKNFKSPCYPAPPQLVLGHPCVPALPLYSLQWAANLCGGLGSKNPEECALLPWHLQTGCAITRIYLDF